MNYKVSILVPVYGVEKYIEKCARSLFEQDYDNLEYVFVDDCTLDNSIQLLEKTLCDYPRRREQVRIVKHEKNRGLGAARNTAVHNATGSFIMHCDSDDWMDTRAVSLLVERQLATDADIVSGKAIMVTKQSRKEIEEPPYGDREELLINLLGSNYSLSHTLWRRLIRASLYHNHHIEVCEGLDMGEGGQVTAKLVYFATNIARINKVVYYYNCENSTSYCRRFETNKDLWQQYLNSYEILRVFFEDKEKKYYIAASENVIYEYWVCAHYAAKQREKVFFEKCKAAINREYANYQYVLGYRNPLKKWFQQQYWVYGTFLRMRSFVYNRVKRVFKLN